MFEYEFMRNALIAVLLVTPLFGLLSTMVVSNRMAFFSDSLGHGAFTGIAIGALLGVGSEIFGLLARGRGHGYRRVQLDGNRARLDDNVGGRAVQ